MTEPTNEALIDDLIGAVGVASVAASVPTDTTPYRARIALVVEALRTRLATLTERAEKAEAKVEELEADLLHSQAAHQITKVMLDDLIPRHEAAEAELARTREALTRTKADPYFDQLDAETQFAVEAALAKPEPAPQEMK